MNSSTGDKLKFDKPRTAVQRKRWACMLRAAEIAKEDARSNGYETKIESKMPVRNVLVNGEAVFEQERDDAVGVFPGKFVVVTFKFKE